ncbi:unnamed protein product [Brassica rapa]|uniref:Uncharacterized protein n=1 Tax=Brassica campestris TaxID=3711 RepID=A0A8D9HE82_BRACM|nr:unnamed protein product [Brassica rapa]CAG7897989.1 unnamed protein product [Brassica rapa]
MALEESFAGCLAERSVKSRIFNILCNQLCIFKSLADLTCLCFGLLLPFLRAIDKLLTLQRKRSSYSNSSSTFAPNVLKVCRTLPSP